MSTQRLENDGPVNGAMPATAPAFQRKERTGRRTFGYKPSRVGAVTDAAMTLLFKNFSLLFYSQILGVIAFMAYVALALTIVLEAAFDPLVLLGQH